MISKVRETIKKYNMIDSGDKIFAAVSGGADSVCLILVLLKLAKELGFSLEVIHVEHGIRGDESKADAKFVKGLCANYGIKCHVYNVDAPSFARKEGCSLEEAARILRYDCFDKHAGEGKIAVAHNMEDNAETILYNMVRGTGIEGVRGIKKVRGAVIRPLIECSRSEIESYLRSINQSYCQDSTNNDVCYARNKIRHNVMPYLNEINDKALLHINNLSKMQEEAVSYINKQAQIAYRQYKREDKLSKDLLNEELIIIKTVIRMFLADKAQSSKDIGSVHIDAVYDLMCGFSGRFVDLPYEMVAVSDYDCVGIIKRKDVRECEIKRIVAPINNIGDTYSVVVGGFKVRLEILSYSPQMEIASKNYTKMLDYDKITSELTIRSRSKGDYIVINSNGDKKALNRYMIDSKIPREERDRLPLVCDGSHVMYVVGGRISEYYKIDNTTTRILMIEVTGECDE